jgi:nucleoporin POM152
VPLNETLLTSGTWEYEVEEVHDGLGNFVSFAAVDDDERPKHQVTAIRQSFQVHERPRVFLRGCSPQSPIRVARNDMALLPVMYESTGKHAIDTPHALAYLFTPEADIVADGYHSANAQLKKQSVKSANDKPLIKEAGLYTLKSVSTDFCEGEVLEPTSCLLQNPPEPSLVTQSD